MELSKRNPRGKKKTSVDLSTMVYGKVPPQARDLEESVLGICLMESAPFDVVASILVPEAFYVDAHQRIFKAMWSLAQKSQNIEILAVVEELRGSEELDIVGGPYYVTQLTNRVVSSANTEHYCRIIHEKFLMREQIRIYGEGIGLAYEDSADAFETLDLVSSQLSAMAVSGTRTRAQGMDQLLVSRLQYYHEMSNRQDDLIGVPTGFPILDKITHGWVPGDLIILAARPSVGKTALALNLARNAATHPHKPAAVAFFSLEMDTGKLVDRLISAETGIGLEVITRAKFQESELTRIYEDGARRLAKTKLFLEFTPTLHILELRAKARILKAQENIGLLIVDYLQLMTGRREDLQGTNREQELANISRNLKSLAGELKIPIIALSQMSRDVEKRGGPPKMSDIRESGAIEQDADVVAFLTREDYEQAQHEGDPELKGLAYIHFKKNRQGILDRVPMRTVLEIQRWMSHEQYNQYISPMPTLGSNWRPVRDFSEKGNEEDPFPI